MGQIQKRLQEKRLREQPTRSNIRTNKKREQKMNCVKCGKDVSGHYMDVGNKVILCEYCYDWHKDKAFLISSKDYPEWCKKTYFEEVADND